MASSYTTNYQLNQWSAADQVLRTEFNADNAKIDAALKGLSDPVAGKAAQSAVDALTQSVSSKADAATVAALSQTVSGKADQADVDALTAKAGWKLIQNVQLTEDNKSVHQPLSIDWSEWATVLLRFQLNFSETTQYVASLYSPDGELRLLEDSWSTKMDFLFYPMYDASFPATGHTVLGDATETAVNYQVLTSFDLFGYNGQLLSGSTLTLWGLK